MTFRLLSFLAVLTLIFSTGIFAPGTANAEDARLIGTYGDWAAYTVTENGNKVCYMVSQPIKAEGDYTKRGDIFAMVTHWPEEGTKNVFSYMTGYPYKNKSNVTVKVNGKTFTLFTHDETAWAPDAETDNSLAQAIRKGSRMIVKGTSSRGTLTTDTFSLKGSANAHQAISKECGI